MLRGLMWGGVIAVALLIIFFLIGMFNPVQEFDNSVIIHSGRNQVFTTYINTDNSVNWIKDLKEVKYEQGKAKDSVGSNFEMVFNKDNVKYTMTKNVDELIYPEYYKYSIEDGNMEKESTARFESYADDSTFVKVTTVIKAKSLFLKASLAIAKGNLEEELKAETDNFKSFIERK